MSEDTADEGSSHPLVAAYDEDGCCAVFSDCDGCFGCSCAHKGYPEDYAVHDLKCYDCDRCDKCYSIEVIPGRVTIVYKV